ncbi:MAG: hypothetical protein KGZ64_03915, partial [Thermaerobacter sp.]|nr:hypothetical protein [Thermaerobacter sp.]
MKRITALLLSLVMMSSLFAGVAFASTTPLVALQASVSGVVARDSAIIVSGALLPIGTPGTTALNTNLYSVAVQHRAPGGSWLGTTFNLYQPITATAGSFSFAFVPDRAGDYRLAVVATAALDTALNSALGTATPLLTHTIGTVAPNSLSVSTTTPSVTWGLYQTGIGQQVTIPLSITRVIGGVLNNFYDTALLSSVTYNGATLASGAAALEAVTSADIAAQVRRVTITQPTGALAAGPLVITVTAENGESIGPVTVNVAARDAFNIIATPSATPTVGTAFDLTVTAFDAAGLLPREAGVAQRLDYTVSRVSGPFAAQPTRRVAGNGAIAWTGLIPRQGGDIVVTTEFYSDTHVLLATVSRTITVAGLRLERPVTTVRRLDETTLRVIVTDAAGNRVNNALVTFEGTAGQFAVRDINTGEFVNTASPTLQVNGLLPTQPRGSSVVNGEYSIDARLRTVGDISVRVQLPRVIGATLEWNPAPQINWTSAIAVNPTLGYTLSLEHTLLAGSADEAVLVTVRDVAGALVNDATLAFTLTDPTAAITPTLTSAVFSGNGVYSLRMNVTAAGSYTITANNTAGTLTGTATISAVAPVVAVTPEGGRLTQNFYDTITVRVTDPRTNVALNRDITVAVRPALTPLRVTTVPTAINFEAQNRALTTTGTTWDEADGIASAVSERQFRILATPNTTALRTIAGVVHEPQVSVVVAGAATTHLTLSPATLQVTPAELFYNRQNDVTVQLLNAHGVGMASSVAISGAVTLASTTLPAAGLTLRVNPVPGVVFAPEATFTVTPVHGTALTVNRPVVLPPADAVAPVITTNAPATTTAATLPVTVTITDDVNVTGIIFEGAAVTIFPARTQTFVRNVTLAVGANTFVVVATDAAGNVTTHSVTITRTAPAAADTAAPIIEVTVPAVTTEATAVVTVTVRDAVNIAANGIIFDGVVIPGFVSREQVFTRTVNLREGMNIFTVAAQDAAGNVTTRTIAVERRTPPAPVSHVITIGRANPAIGLDVPANVRNGRLMVPFRWFGERILEATVDYRVQGTAEIVTLVKGNISVELTLNSTIAKVNGTPVALDVAAFATGGRTLVPARFLAET